MGCPDVPEAERHAATWSVRGCHSAHEGEPRGLGSSGTGARPKPTTPSAVRSSWTSNERMLTSVNPAAANASRTGVTKSSAPRGSTSAPHQRGPRRTEVWHGGHGGGDIGVADVGGRPPGARHRRAPWRDPGRSVSSRHRRPPPAHRPRPPRPHSPARSTSSGSTSTSVTDTRAASSRSASTPRTSRPSPAHKLTTRTGPGRASSSARSTSRTKARRRGRLEAGASYCSSQAR